MRDERYHGVEPWIEDRCRGDQPDGVHRQTVFFDSALEFVDCMQAHMQHWQETNSQKYSSTYTDRDRTRWAGGTWQQAVALARTGWKEGADRVRRLSDGYTAAITNLVDKTVYYYDVSGSYVDVARYVEGEPEHFWEFATERVQQAGTRIHRIIVQGGYSSVTEEDTIYRRGAAITALVDVLETVGIRTEIQLVATARGNQAKGWFEYRVPVKEADEPLDIDRVAYFLAHPSSLRRLGFACDERFLPESEHGCYGIRANGTYGWARDTPDTVYRSSGLYVGENNGQDAWRYDKQAVAWIISQLQALGIEVKQGAAA